jgi:hypothetical protein
MIMVGMMDMEMMGDGMEMRRTSFRFLHRSREMGGRRLLARLDGLAWKAVDERTERVRKGGWVLLGSDFCCI